jgi:hypothetical protein
MFEVVDSASRSRRHGLLLTCVALVALLLPPIAAELAGAWDLPATTAQLTADSAAIMTAEAR